MKVLRGLWYNLRRYYGLLRCVDCKVRIPLEEYGKGRVKSWTCRCRPCNNIYQKPYAEKRARRLKDATPKWLDKNQKKQMRDMYRWASYLSRVMGSLITLTISNPYREKTDVDYMSLGTFGS